jgi:putative ATPase
LSEEALETLLARAERHLGLDLPLTEDARALLIESADGDGRYLINLIETVIELADPASRLEREQLIRLTQRRAANHDKDRDAHYNLISALHKSLRASDVDAALYWLARILTGGEDPRYVTRRLIRFASEDIGLADPAGADPGARGTRSL